MTPETARLLLQLPPTATPADVEGSFRRLAHQLHPDRGGDAESFRLLMQARLLLHTSPSESRRRRTPLIVVHRGPWWRRLVHALRAYIERRCNPPPPRVQ
ncbi:MAG: J domain-containing protein [Actinomycetota bacterium]|nr:J domain-containing protein [Actinomycetota bacterium]